MHLLPVRRRGKAVEGGAEAGVGFDHRASEKTNRDIVGIHGLKSGGLQYVKAPAMSTSSISPKCAPNRIPYGQSPFYSVSRPSLCTYFRQCSSMSEAVEDSAGADAGV